MELVWSLLCLGIPFVGVSMLIGGILAIIDLLPPIRKLGQENPTLHQIKSLLFSNVAFVVVFGLYTFSLVDIVYVEFTVNPSSGPCSECADYVSPDEFNQHRQLVTLELWIRTLLPPMLSNECFTAHTTVCQVATKVMHRVPLPWNIYMLFVISGIAAGTTSYLLVRKIDGEFPSFD